jgi:hypothetical protein
LSSFSDKVLSILTIILSFAPDLTLLFLVRYLLDIVFFWPFSIPYDFCWKKDLIHG